MNTPFRALLSIAMIALIGLAPGASGVTPPLRVTASGDFGKTTNTDLVLKGIAAQAPDLHLALGDFAYTKAGTEASWCTYLHDRVGTTLPFQLVSGNHDSGLYNATGKFYETFIDAFAACLPNRLPGLSGTYGRKWYVDTPATNPVARIVVASPNIKFRHPTTKVTTTASYAVGTPEYAWLSDTIDAARQQQIPWVIVAMHYPCLTPGRYDCDNGWSMSKDVMDLLVTKHVDLVLTGHEHLYARSYQLGYATGCEDRTVLHPALNFDSAGTVVDPDCVRTTASDMTKGNGTVFGIVGTGGRPLENVNLADAEAGYFAALSGGNRAPTFGSLELTITSTQLTGTFRAVGTGTFRDTFTIRDPVLPPPPPPADGDKDGTPDTADLCPTRPGPIARKGCPIRFVGTAAADRIVGSPFADTITGLAGNDVLRGEGGVDTIGGGPGRDFVVGGPGNDVLSGGLGRDTLYGGNGHDRIAVRDGLRDVVYCGAGTDTAIADKLDVLIGCERGIRK